MLSFPSIHNGFHYFMMSRYLPLPSVWVICADWHHIEKLQKDFIHICFIASPQCKPHCKISHGQIGRALSCSHLHLTSLRTQRFGHSALPHLFTWTVHVSCPSALHVEFCFSLCFHPVPAPPSFLLTFGPFLTLQLLSHTSHHTLNFSQQQLHFTLEATRNTSCASRLFQLF
jgi:hypothetical protein